MWNKKDDKETSDYIRLKKIFTKFTTRYTREEITELIDNTPSPGRQWGLPKGGQKPGEQSLNCGLRELAEETSITSSDCTVLHNFPPITEDYVDVGTRYVLNYFTAYQNNNSPAKPFVKESQKIEISEAEWVPLREIEKFNMEYSFKERLITTCTIAMNNFKQSIDRNYYEIYKKKDDKEDTKEEEDGGDAW